MKRKRCIAMLLAGGQGTRLYALTSKVAKPAVSFGGKYRIIDFTLSNITNSGLDTVGVLTQYQPLVLNEYLDNGSYWDLDRTNGGLHVLPPYMAKSGGEWYKGTANAIYQNLHFLNRYDAEHVLILSGDHIYKMDYSKMLKEHIENDADCTIAVIDVPASEAGRFGIIDFREDLAVIGFEEKPARPRGNHASMGVYIFKKEVLIDELRRDEADPSSSNDFGKNIIPSMLARGRRLFAYLFSGYWKDVGTVTSLWEANMDLLGPEPKIDLSDSFTVYSHNDALPPCYIGDGGRLDNSLATAGCEIYGSVYNSIISENVKIGRGSVVRDSVIMRNAVIGENCFLDYAVVDERAVVGDGCVLGGEGSDKEHIVLVGRERILPGNVRIAAGAIVE